MSSTGSGYDLSASQYSPEGRVFQVEYACKAVDSCGTAIAMKAKDGVVFAVENIVTSMLYEPRSQNRILQITNNIGMCVTGLIPAAKHLVSQAKTECASFRKATGQDIPLSNLVHRLSEYMHAYTLYSSVQPFGVSVMLSSMDTDGPKLFMIDPSGTYHSYLGCAAGKAKQNVKTEMEKLDLTKMSCKDLRKEAARIIYTVHDEIKDKNFELEMSWVGEATGNLHKGIQGADLQELETYAQTSIADVDSEDDL